MYEAVTIIQLSVNTDDPSCQSITYLVLSEFLNFSSIKGVKSSSLQVILCISKNVWYVYSCFQSHWQYEGVYIYIACIQHFCRSSKYLSYDPQFRDTNCSFLTDAFQNIFGTMIVPM